MKRLKVVGTANFARNLEALRDFHTEHPDGFVRAIARLRDAVLPLLRQQPHLGRLHHEGQLPRPVIERVRGRLGGGTLREVLLDEYVILYLVREKQLALLSIRHGREVDFDFGD